METSFQQRVLVKYQGICFTAIFLVAFLAYPAGLLLLEDPAQHGFHAEHSAVIVTGMGMVVFGSMLLMSVWMWVSYHRERFRIDEDHLQLITVLRDRRIAMQHLERIQWRCTPIGGSIVFHGKEQRIAFDLYGYSREHRLQIIQRIRALTPTVSQEGWNEFCLRIALPLKTGLPSRAHVPEDAELIRICRKRYDRAALLIIPAATVAAVLIQQQLGYWEGVALPVLLSGAWLLLRYSVPREGMQVARMRSTTAGRVQLTAMATLILTLVGMIAAAALGMQRDLVCLVACIPVSLVLVWMMVSMHRDEQRQQQDRTAAAAAAAHDFEDFD